MSNFILLNYEDKKGVMKKIMRGKLTFMLIAVLLPLTLPCLAGADVIDGGETLINNSTNNFHERDGDVAINKNGIKVVVWEKSTSSKTDIYAKVYNLNNSAQNVPEFVVNNNISDHPNHLDPAVAIDDAGNFTIVWEVSLLAASHYCESGVWAKRFNKSGAQLNNYGKIGPTSSKAPDVAMNGAGKFVITWVDGSTIDAKPYSATGSAGSTITVTSTNTPLKPSAIVDSTGGFVIAWEGNNGTNGKDIYFRRYNSSNAVQGTSPTIANIYKEGGQYTPDIDIDDSGNFTVVWDSDSATQNGIYGAHFNVSGTRISSASEDVKISTYAGNQSNPKLVLDNNGNFLTAWESLNQDGSGKGIYAQQFESYNKSGGEFKINTYTAGDQAIPSITIDDKKNYTLQWHSEGQDAATSGIYGKVYKSILFVDAM